MTAPLPHSELILLGHQEMDTIHQELMDLLGEASGSCDAVSMAVQLDVVIEHTDAHFASEEQWMEQSQFPLIAEHCSEHKQLLGELKMMRRRLRPVTLPLVRNFLEQRLPDWLNTHLQRMDSLLAAHLVRCR